MVYPIIFKVILISFCNQPVTSISVHQHLEPKLQRFTLMWLALLFVVGQLMGVITVRPFFLGTSFLSPPCRPGTDSDPDHAPASHQP